MWAAKVKPDHREALYKDVICLFPCKEGQGRDWIELEIPKCKAYGTMRLALLTKCLLSKEVTFISTQLRSTWVVFKSKTNLFVPIQHSVIWSRRSSPTLIILWLYDIKVCSLILLPFHSSTEISKAGQKNSPDRSFSISLHDILFIYQSYLIKITWNFLIRETINKRFLKNPLNSYAVLCIQLVMGWVFWSKF